MNKIIIIIFIFLNITNLSAEEKDDWTVTRLHGSKDLPMELNLLVESLGASLGYKKILPMVLNIDSYARVLNKEDIFLIGKIEIYKTLLKSNELFPKAVIDGDSVVLLKKVILRTGDPFVNWFLQALLRDCESLLENPKFKEYLLQKSNGPIQKPELKKIDKKVKIIYRWISKINLESGEFQDIFKAELTPMMIDSLINIEESFFLMASGTMFEPMPGLIKTAKELKFFSLKTSKLTEKIIKKEKSVEDILAPLTEEPKPMETKLPTPSSEDWLNQDNAPTNLKNLPKPNDDADWLQDF